MKYLTGENASIKSLHFKDREIPFRQDSYRSALYAVMDKRTVTAQWQPAEDGSFHAVMGSLDAVLRYKAENDIFTVLLTIRNTSSTSSFKPTTLGFRTGIDCYMEKFPEWNEKYFPTLLRCEKTHFWGYCMTPSGHILTITCPQPTASWSLDYNELQDEMGYLRGGHRIYSCSLRLLNRLPKPDRHPLMDELLPEQEMTWAVSFSALTELSAVPKRCSELLKAPMLTLDRYTLDEGEQTSGCVFGEAAAVYMMSESGERTALKVTDGQFETPPLTAAGSYRILAEGNGKTSEALIYQKHQNSWYLDKARDAILEMPPVYTHHMEAFDGLFTILSSRRYLPDQQKDAQCEAYFQNIFRQLYNFETNRVNETPQRIQDSAALSCLMARRYQITGDLQDLRVAGHLADFLLSCQHDDGAYYSEYGRAPKGVHYTAVTYIAKYIRETGETEQAAAETYPEFAEAAKRHLDSAQRAAENLWRLRDNIDTEGELTFEDGMISCSMYQIAEAALHFEEDEQRAAYTETAEYMYQLHRCLTQLMIPDCRMNSCTLRFWEAQYNLHIFHNVMNSPCGWTAWKLYGVYDLYLLTGKTAYLRDFINGMGACLQLVDGKSGHLRWGFLCDPYVETLRYVQQGEGVCRGKLVDDILSEQYADMVSSWHRTEIFPRKKWCIDNLVYEVFKCLSDTILRTAFVYEDESGRLQSYNCTIQEGKELTVTPREKLVNAVHCNFSDERTVTVQFEKPCQEKVRFGWIRQQA